ncbi:hypothetical protein Ancab_015673 [Ancistrocladus abbreviatus]
MKSQGVAPRELSHTTGSLVLELFKGVILSGSGVTEKHCGVGGDVRVGNKHFDPPRLTFSRFGGMGMVFSASSALLFQPISKVHRH